MKNAILLLSLLIPVAISAGETRDSVPIIYSTDLYHPHDDPDDHFDLATLFALPEFDILAIVIDRGERGAKRPGVVAIEQMMHITSRNVPYACGLTHNLTSPSDQAKDQPKEDQSGVNRILQALRESQRPVTVFTTGSLRDVAAAYNRDPELFKKKVARLYINAGHSAGGDEWNVKLDRFAYVRMLEATLPIYWMPCFGENGYRSLWQFEQGQVFDAAAPTLQNFFVFALTQASPQKVDPIRALSTAPEEDIKNKLWKMKRNMWCTAGFLHAAGRKNGTFAFRKMAVNVEETSGKTHFASDGEGIALFTFHRKDEEAYTRSMVSKLRNLFASLGE